MGSTAGRKSALTWMVHLSVFLLVALWTLPTAGLFISSFRDKDQLAVSGWWTALATADQNLVGRAKGAEAQFERDGKFVINGSLSDESEIRVSAFGFKAQEPGRFEPGQTADMGDGKFLTVNADGSYEIVSATPMEGSRGERIFFTSPVPPRFTLENYREVLNSEGIGRAFLNSFTVTVPATIIPILVAAFAAYALAWMKFPGRTLIVAIVVGLLVVPLQLSLIPLLTMYNAIGQHFGIPAKGYVGIWLAHTGFGLPLAIYLLRNYIAGLPGEIIESARIDGASDFEIFRKIVLPLSYPALASFAIFQFLWVWNDLLVALVFLGPQKEELVLTGKLVNLLGSRGGNWEILTASAFITILVPLAVFFSLQKFLVRGLLAGSVKGG
jgi:alpha-glucoside transport system permease protein